MAAITATVLVPTHNHGALLERAVESALTQSVPDIEVIIVGDGVDDATRTAAVALERRDSRVQFMDLPKGPRHGELNRHEALQHASGRIVCYLSDDDLWLPGHVGAMASLLEDADFAHSLPIGIRIDGAVHTWTGNLGVKRSRSRVRAHRNFIPLSCGAHTLASYRDLPHGWRTTPEGTATDVFMWAQFLDSGAAAVSGTRPTALSFPSPWRQEMTLQQRLEEMQHWLERLQDSGLENSLLNGYHEHVAARRLAQRARIRRLLQRVETTRKQLRDTESSLDIAGAAVETLESTNQELRARAESLDGRINDLTAIHRDLEAQNEVLRRQEAALTARVEDQSRRIASMQASLTWRARNRLLRLPVLGGVIRILRAPRAARSTKPGSAQKHHGQRPS